VYRPGEAVADEGFGPGQMRHTALWRGPETSPARGALLSR
jgi:hypothetical protein